MFNTAACFNISLFDISIATSAFFIVYTVYLSILFLSSLNLKYVS